ncbi:MAG: hypothetical protein ACQCN5_04580 [Candidatus Bathyarchaeia archaeon]
MTTYEKIQASKLQLLSGNLLALAWILLGTFGCWLINPLYGWLFLGFSAFVTYGILRRMTCSSCYYCKSCTKGITKLSLLFLGANHIPGMGKGTILAMDTTIYVVLTLIPGWLLTSSLLAEYDLLKLVVLGGLAGVSIIALIGLVYHLTVKPKTKVKTNAQSLH